MGVLFNHVQLLPYMQEVVTMLENLRKLREDAHITQKQLAEIIGVSQQSINKYENHNIEPDIETLIRIADHFGTSVDYLIGHNTSPHKETTAQAYGLSGEEQTLLARYRALNTRQKKAVLSVIQAFRNE